MKAALSEVGRYSAAARLFAIPTALIPVVVAFAVSDRPALWHWDRLIAALLAVSLFNVAGNLLNDYFDYVQNVDRRIDGDAGRPGRMLLHGRISTREVLTEALVGLGIAVVPVLYLLWECGPAVMAFVAFAVLGLYSYTGPPLKLKYRALGEPWVFLLFGPVLMAAAGFLQTGRIEPEVLWVSLPIGLATTAVLFGNNIRDAREDREAGIRTLAHVTGRTAGVVYVVLLLSAAAAPAALAVVGGFPPGLLLSPLTLLLVRAAAAAAWRGRRMPDIDVRTARFSAALSALILLAFLVG